MLKFGFLWSMCSDERLFDERTRCGFWMHELNANYKLKYICEQNKQRNPDFIEVHRKSPAGEIIISGNFEIKELINGPSVMKKRIICLIEDGCLFSRIDLRFSRDTTKPPLKVFVLAVDITISCRTEDNPDMTELVHLTHTDVSSLRQLSNDMGKLLLEKPLFADVSLKCGDISIAAHKNILSARSPVFEAMFSCPMREAMENEVVIEDTEAPAFQAMIKYMYTGKIEALTTSLATDLLFVAAKYQVEGLESFCSKHLMRNISIKNVVAILVTGDLLSPNLKKFAIDFVCNKCVDYSALEKRAEWMDLKKDNSALALDVFSAVVKFQESKLKMRI